MEAEMQPPVHLVGAGLTSSLVARFLRQASPSLPIKVFEKARGIGGRTMAKRLDEAGGVRADVGAQLITLANDASDLTRQIVSECVEKSIAAPFAGVIAGPNPYSGESYVVTHADGFAALAKHFLKEAGAEVNLSTYARELAADANSSGKLLLIEENGGALAEAPPGVVVVTIPVPQFLGESRFPFSTSLPDDAGKRAALAKVQYSSRHVLVVHWDASATPPPACDWTMKYFDGKSQSAIRYVCWDDRKRANTSASGGGRVLVAHTSALWSLKNELPLDQVEGVLLEDVKKLLPEVFASSPDGFQTKTHFWRYSQVYKNALEVGATDTEGFLQLHDNVFLTGDAFSRGVGVDACVKSAKATSERVLQRLRDVGVSASL